MLTTSPFSILAADLAAFQVAYPDFDCAAVDGLRAREYARLDAEGHTYLDYTGAGLYADSQVCEHLALLRQGVFGNPHSTNPTSLAATEHVERARASVLDFFGAPPEEYAVVFTANASTALKLVGEAYPFDPGSRLVLTADNHNSVNGMREFAYARSSRVSYVPLELPELRVDPLRLADSLRRPRGGAHDLFVYPAQSNFSGVQHPLEWIELAHANGWDVLLDAAAFAPTNRLDLSRWRPDFVTLSFYKLFGYPTGIGCLLARRAALAKLRRPWFAGGTIKIVSVGANGHDLLDGEGRFEDGTLDFLGLSAIEIGLRHLNAVGVSVINQRVRSLTDWLVNQLVDLRHPNGAPLVQAYGPHSAVSRGGTVAFNVLGPDGSLHDYRQIVAAANRWQISLRGGCFCNPGASEAALGLTLADLAPLFVNGDRPSNQALNRRYAYGAVRASVGIATTPADLFRFVRFVRGFAGEPAHRVRNLYVERLAVVLKSQEVERPALLDQAGFDEVVDLGVAHAGFGQHFAAVFAEARGVKHRLFAGAAEAGVALGRQVRGAIHQVVR
jgi:molybdenum cofactor sulfurtransferase